MASKKIYFASDQHFGAPTPEASFPREQKFVAWLDEVKQDAEAIFLLGDLFAKIQEKTVPCTSNSQNK